MLNFAKEVYRSVMSPVWKFVPRRKALYENCTSHEDRKQCEPSDCSVCRSGTCGGKQHETAATNTIENYRSTKNPCRLCTPFGACMAFNGIAGCAPFIHGSQGCSTYIRRYLIGHFREPVDIACSNFSESNTIFGGLDNLTAGLDNVISQYNPKMIGICTTCLAETIGDDVSMFLNEYKKNRSDQIFTGTCTYIDGKLLRLIYRRFSQSGAFDDRNSREKTKSHEGINIFPPIISPEDLRYLKEIFEDFEIDAMILPDYSDSFDGQVWEKYESNIDHGTAIDKIRDVWFGKSFDRNFLHCE